MSLKTSAAIIMMIAMSIPDDSLAKSSSDVAYSLGLVLGSEQPCGLSYNQEAIEAFIDKNVAADDMDFSGSLSLFVDGQASEITKYGPSQMAAHCRQMRRVAKSYGFIK